MKFVAYYGPGSLPTWLQQKEVHGLVFRRNGHLIHEIEEKADFDDGCFGLKEAKRLAVKHSATLIASSMGILSRNLNLFQEVREQVPVIVCDSGGPK